MADCWLFSFGQPDATTKINTDSDETILAGNKNSSEELALPAVAMVAAPSKEARPLILQLALPLSILLGALLISGTLIWTQGNPAADNGTAAIGQPEKVDIKIKADDYVLGSQNAKVTLVEYSDFQCPFCRKFWNETLSQIKKEYIDTGKAKFVYRHYPLDFHPAALPSAQAVECAGEQGKFWELHDKLFSEQQKLNSSGTVEYGIVEIKQWAGQIDLAMNEFNQCLDSNKYSQKINDQLASGTQAGVSGTPTLFVNGQKIVGAQPYANFKATIDATLAK